MNKNKKKTLKEKALFVWNEFVLTIQMFFWIIIFASIFIGGAAEYWLPWS